MKHFNDFLLMTIIKLKLEVGTNNSRNVLRDNFAFQLSSVSNWTWGPVEYTCNTMHPNLLFGQLPSRIEKNSTRKLQFFSMSDTNYPHCSAFIILCFCIPHSEKLFLFFLRSNLSLNDQVYNIISYRCMANSAFYADFLSIGRYHTVLHSISALTFNAVERHQIWQAEWFA